MESIDLLERITNIKPKGMMKMNLINKQILKFRSFLMRLSFIPFLYFLFLISLFSACSNSSQNQSNTQNTDTLQCWVDSSLTVLSSELNKSYENVFKFPRFKYQSFDEAEIIKGLMNNSVNLAILHRKLDSIEVDILKRKENFTPKQYVFAYDAYVFITSDQAGNFNLDYDRLKNYLKFGIIEDLMTLCVESPKSQTLYFLKTHFKTDTSIYRKLYSLGSMDKMMNYLRSNPGTVGIIPFSLISDIESVKTIEFLKGLRVMNVSWIDSSGKKQVVEPSQSTITTLEYPLISPLVLVNSNMEKKTGTNFVNYIFKTKAQRLIQQFGLVPAIFPGREVVIHQ